ncbi:MAG TPA: hypothetical protein VFZ64_12140 [Nocardioidaceae bacterium]
MDPMIVAALARSMHQDTVLDLDSPEARHGREAARRRRARRRQARATTWRAWRRRWRRERRKAPVTA